MAKYSFNYILTCIFTVLSSLLVIGSLTIGFHKILTFDFNVNSYVDIKPNDIVKPNDEFMESFFVNTTFLNYMTNTVQSAIPMGLFIGLFVVYFVSEFITFCLLLMDLFRSKKKYFEIMNLYGFTHMTMIVIFGALILAFTYTIDIPTYSFQSVTTNDFRIVKAKSNYIDSDFSWLDMESMRGKYAGYKPINATCDFISLGGIDKIYACKIDNNFLTYTTEYLDMIPIIKNKIIDYFNVYIYMLICCFGILVIFSLLSLILTIASSCSIKHKGKKICCQRNYDQIDTVEIIQRESNQYPSPSYQNNVK